MCASELDELGGETLASHLRRDVSVGEVVHSGAGLVEKEVVQNRRLGGCS